MTLKKRITNLEQSPKVNKPERVQLIVVTGDIEGIVGMDAETLKAAKEKYQAECEAKVQKAIAEHLAAHPEDVEKRFDIVQVIDEECKRMLERVRTGERTGRDK